MLAKRPFVGLALLLLPTLTLGQESAIEPGFVSILPPLIAIFIALVFRQVIPALFVGLWFGAWAVSGLDFRGLWSGLLDTGTVYVTGALVNPDHAAVILFTLMIGGMVGIISRNGGLNGIVLRLATWASNARRAALTTAGMGLAVFFDDYANTLVVGKTMRPITDRMNISRAKLAYIVDSTAAPVACIALITTWIGYEVGLIDEAIGKISLDTDAYLVFLGSLKYSFYPVLAIGFVFLVAWTGLDFGPMRQSEQAASQGRPGKLPDPDDSIQPGHEQPARAINAVLPVLTLIGAVVAGLLITGGAGDGENKSLQQVIGDADSYKALMWGSLLGVLVAAVLTVAQGVLSLDETVEAWFSGVRSMISAIIILVLAWALSATCDALGTAPFLVSTLGESISPPLLPSLVFVLAALTAFGTGSSWGTMGILMPLVIPLAWVLSGSSLDGTSGAIFHATVACVLGGAVWGDHCSPISDTTILSSMASSCDHIEHVRTQLPYALTVGSVAIVLGLIPASLGLPWWLCYLLCATLLIAVLMWLGRPTLAGEAAADAPE